MWRPAEWNQSVQFILLDQDLCCTLCHEERPEFCLSVQFFDRLGGGSRVSWEPLRPSPYSFLVFDRLGGWGSLFTSCVMPEELWEDGGLHARPWALFLFGIIQWLMTDASLAVSLSCSLRKMGEAFFRARGMRCPGRDQHRDKSLPPLVA